MNLRITLKICKKNVGEKINTYRVYGSISYASLTAFYDLLVILSHKINYKRIIVALLDT